MIQMAGGGGGEEGEEEDEWGESRGAIMTRSSAISKIKDPPSPTSTCSTHFALKRSGYNSSVSKIYNY